MAKSEKTVLLENILKKNYEKTKKSYLHWETLRKDLGATGRKKFGGLTAKATWPEVKRAVEPFLDPDLAFIEVYGEYYLTENITSEKLQREIDAEKTDYLLTILKKHKDKEKRSHMPLKLKAADLKIFGLKASPAPSVATVEKVIAQFLGSELQILKKPPKTKTGKDILYLAYNLPPEEFIKESHQVLNTKKTFALKTLATGVPMSDKDFVAVFNGMLAAGQLQVTKIDEKFGIVGIKVSTQSGDCAEYRSVPGSLGSQLTTHPSFLDAELFHAAFEKLDHGRIFVRICNMRRELGWSEERFNAMLNQLWTAGTIQLRAGDASSMTDEEINLSYTDENNFFYATLTWKK